MHHDWLSYSRTGNVLHAFLRANIQELTFHQTVKTELSDSKDRAVNSMEIFDSIKKIARSVLKPGKVVTIL